jgi:hypothetical protein
MVWKPDGSWWPCSDYWRLNLVMVPDSYPLPNMLDFSEKIAGCKIFSKVDLRKGYHQILMPCVYSEDRDSDAIWSIQVFWMTFGLRNAGNTIQRRMDRIMADLEFVFVYLDDFIIGSRSVEEGVEEVEFLGHHVNAIGVAPIASRVAAILWHPQPTTVKELQGFLGVINFYRSFMPAAACILKPLRPAEGEPEARCRRPLDGRDAGGLCGGQSSSDRECLAHPPFNWSRNFRNFSVSGCLSRAHRGGVAAAAASGGPVAAPRILLEEAGCHAGQILCLR